MFYWYRVFNYQNFLDSGLVSVEATLALETVEKQIMITRGNLVSVLVDDELLTLNLNGKNPYRHGTHAIFLDKYGDVHLGFWNEN